ncbi:MAG: deoxyhypusine synthase family protein [Vicinamibacterales bacterium]
MSNRQHHQASAPGPVSAFLRRHFRHFNAATIIDAADAYASHTGSGGAMMMTLAGAMSTAELGLSLAEMIRQDQVQAICCTGANLEEDVFNLVAHHDYVRVPHYRDLTPHDEQQLLDRHLNRVTDTCIPEAEAMRRVERFMIEEWKDAEARGERLFPYEFLYRILRRGDFSSTFQIPASDSWLFAAMEKQLPVFVPGWEDSTLGNMFAAVCLAGEVRSPHVVRTGIETMQALADWYSRTAAARHVGFFQIGGGIAGDFAICVVPMLRQDLRKNVPLWSYFCQISDSTTSYGSYSGASPNEKITWEKLAAETPKFVIESDATIVAPLLFGCVLNW